MVSAVLSNFATTNEGRMNPPDGNFGWLSIIGPHFLLSGTQATSLHTDSQGYKILFKTRLRGRPKGERNGSPSLHYN